MRRIPATISAVSLAMGLLSCAPQRRLAAGDYRGGPSQPKMVALTFDDGPLEPYTSQILDILKAHNAKATFFVCGAAVKRDPAVLKRMVREGQEIGNHTWSHVRLADVPLAEAEKQIIDTENIIRETIGRPPTLLRPPQWSFNSKVGTFAFHRGYAVVWATVTSLDWKISDVNKIVDNVMRKVKPGSVVLLHDGLNAWPGQNRSATVKALPIILAKLEHAGFTMVTISKMHSAKLIPPLKKHSPKKH